MVAFNSARDLEALAPFLEDFMISRNFSRPWVELYRNVTDDASDLLEMALARHTGQLRTDIRTDALDGIEHVLHSIERVQQGIEHVSRRLEEKLPDRGIGAREANI